jgi:hypothetical protein
VEGLTQLKELTNKLMSTRRIKANQQNVHFMHERSFIILILFIRAELMSRRRDQDLNLDAQRAWISNPVQYQIMRSRHKEILS